MGILEAAAFCYGAEMKRELVLWRCWVAAAGARAPLQGFYNESSLATIPLGGDQEKKDHSPHM